MTMLHVTSGSSSFKIFLGQTKLPISESYEKGDTFSSKRPPHKDYGFSCKVSKGKWDDFYGQVQDALEFLKKFETELINLMQKCSVDDIRLDFGYSCRLSDKILVQCDFLPPELLKMAGKLNIGIELSLYSS